RSQTASGDAGTTRPTSNVNGNRSRLQPLDDHGHALAAADAHGLETDGLVQRLQVVDEGGHDAGPGLAERVAQRDGAAVRVELAVDVDADLVAHRQHLSRERLVQLDDVDVGDLHARRLEDLAARFDRADAHDL